MPELAGDLRSSVPSLAKRPVFERAEVAQPPSLSCRPGPRPAASIVPDLSLGHDERRIVDAEIEAVAVTKLLVAQHLARQDRR